MKNLLKQPIGSKRSQIGRDLSLPLDQPNPSIKIYKNIFFLLFSQRAYFLIHKSVICMTN